METDIERILIVLQQSRVEFVVIGGIAAMAHGAAYVTYDIDVCYRRTRDNVQRLCDALAPLHPRLRGASESLPFRFDLPTVEAGLNFTLSTDAGSLDLMGEVIGLGGFDEIIRQAEEMELFGLPIYILSLDGLIRAKKAAGRAKDLLLATELEALRELLDDQ